MLGKPTGNLGCLIIIYYLVGIILVISAFFYFKVIGGTISFIAYIGIGRLYENWMGKLIDNDEQDGIT